MIRWVIFCLFLPSTVFSHGEDTTIYEFPDIEAKFPGGPAALMRFAVDNFSYLDTIVEEPPSKMYFEFIVEKDGTLTGFKVLRPTHPAYYEHYLKAFMQMPKWEPAQWNGQAVRSKYRFPLILCYD